MLLAARSWGKLLNSRALVSSPIDWDDKPHFLGLSWALCEALDTECLAWILM